MTPCQPTELQPYRYISGRTLLALPKLARCQDLPPETWTSPDHLWHFVFISHRWGSQTDPDPDGTQLAALKRLAQHLSMIAEVISDERVGPEVAQERLKQIPSLRRQGTLQAAHLLFRCLCDAESQADAEELWQDGQGILARIGFWYDYACLPQDPKTPAEAEEFTQALQGIGELLLSPQVSTLALRKEGDGYLSRGWCFAEAMIAQSRNDPYRPMVLWTDRWDKPVSILNDEPFSVFKPDVEKLIAQWENPANGLSALDSFHCVIQGTALCLLLKSEQGNSEFALAWEDTVRIGAQLLAEIQPRLVMVSEGGRLDLAVPLATLLARQGLACRERRDAILVALLLLTSLTSEAAVGEVGIWRQALVRLTQGLLLEMVRRDGALLWQS